MGASVASIGSAVGEIANYSIPMAAGVQDGDLLICAVTSEWDTLADNAIPAGFTPLGTATYNGGTNNVHVALGYRIAASEPASYTANPGSGSGSVGAIIRVIGHDSTPVIVQVAPVGFTSEAAATAPSLVPSGADDLLLCFFGAELGNSNCTWTPPPGMTEVLDLQQSTYTTMHIASLQSPSSPSGTKHATPTNLSFGGACTISIKSAATGSTPNNGSGSGVLHLTGSGTGSTGHAGSGSGTAGVTGSGSGSTTRTGSGSGVLALLGSGTGKAPVSGSGTGQLLLTGTGTGSTGHDGSGSGSLSLSGAGSGSTPHAGSGAGLIEVVGTGTGHAPTVGGAAGSGSGVIGVTGSGSGHAPAVGPHSGSGTGTLAISGSGTGLHDPHGSGSGTIEVIATGLGTAPRRGSGSGVLALTGSGHGTTPGQPVRDLTIISTGPPTSGWITTSPDKAKWVGIEPGNAWAGTEPADNWTTTEPDL